MKYKRITALLLAVCVLALGAPALATGIIGSISGVQEGEGIFTADQGALTEDANAPEGKPADGASPNPAPDGVQPTDAPPAETVEPVPTASGYDIGEQASALYLRLHDEAPIQEGWQIQFAGDSILAMWAVPELIVWNIQPESGIMELLWYRDMYEFMPDSEGNPLVMVSPDGTKAVVSPSDGSVYLIDAQSTEQVAPEGTAPGRIVWARDSESFACINGSEISVHTLEGSELLIEGQIVLPVNGMLEWLNPGATPAALEELLGSETWTYAGTGETCVLFDSEDGSASCAYMLNSGVVVNYPEAIYSSMTIGRSGASPLYDGSAERYRLYLSDGSYADIPMLDVISEGEMANPYGWLGDSICVLEQDFSARSAFRLHAANTATGITYTLLTPWEYAEMMNGQQKAE